MEKCYWRLSESYFFLYPCCFSLFFLNHFFFTAEMRRAFSHMHHISLFCMFLSFLCPFSIWQLNCFTWSVSLFVPACESLKYFFLNDLFYFFNLCLHFCKCSNSCESLGSVIFFKCFWKESLCHQVCIYLKIRFWNINTIGNKQSNSNRFLTPSVLGP